jgi:hypothetical protein
MTKKGMFSAAAAVLITTGLLASGDGAVSMTSAQTCAALQKQWDSAVTTMASAANAVSARKLATTAATDCKAGKPKSGVADYRKALQAIGEKPKY